jgi:hypothetical protein
MHPNAQKTLVAMFCEANRLNVSGIGASVQVVIANVEAPFGLFVENLEPSRLAESENPVDGLLITLLHRLHDTVSGALALLAIGRFQQAEILSRTVMESALSLQYILSKDTGFRLAEYFLGYVKVEREQNQKWLKTIEGSPKELRDEHQCLIKEKDEALVGYELFIDHFRVSLAEGSHQPKAWPSTYDICVALGKAVDYRTVYMAMCSQAHHDAEDILNAFMVGSSPDYDTRSKRLECETANFSIFMLLCSLRYYIECFDQMALRYGFHSVEMQSSRSHALLTEMAERVSSESFINQEFDNFLPKRNLRGTSRHSRTGRL